MILVNACEWLAVCHGVLQKVGKFVHRHSKLHTHSLYSSLSLLPTHTVKYPISMLSLRSKVSPVVQSSNPFHCLQTPK